MQEVMDLLRERAHATGASADYYWRIGIRMHGDVGTAVGWVYAGELVDVVGEHSARFWPIMDDLCRQQMAEKRPYRRTDEMHTTLVSEGERTAFRLHPMVYASEVTAAA